MRAPEAVTRVQADTDATLPRLWLHGRSRSTMTAYAGDARAFLAFVGKPLAEVRVGELQDYILTP